MKTLLGLLAAMMALALAIPAEAKVVSFKISGDYSATFRLDASPTPPADYVVDGYSFGVDGVAITSGAGSFSGGITFFNESATGGILINQGFDYLLDVNGFQLYSGAERAPTFLPGSYTLSGLSTPGTFVVTIAAVPETATWVMLIGGFGVTGAAIRYRRRVGGKHRAA